MNDKAKRLPIVYKQGCIKAILDSSAACAQLATYPGLKEETDRKAINIQVEKGPADLVVLSVAVDNDIPANYSSTEFKFRMECLLSSINAVLPSETFLIDLMVPANSSTLLKQRLCGEFRSIPGVTIDRILSTPCLAACQIIENKDGDTEGALMVLELQDTTLEAAIFEYSQQHLNLKFVVSLEREVAEENFSSSSGLTENAAAANQNSQAGESVRTFAPQLKLLFETPELVENFKGQINSVIIINETETEDLEIATNELLEKEDFGLLVDRESRSLIFSDSLYELYIKYNNRIAFEADTEKQILITQGCAGGLGFSFLDVKCRSLIPPFTHFPVVRSLSIEPRRFFSLLNPISGNDLNCPFTLVECFPYRGESLDLKQTFMCRLGSKKDLEFLNSIQVTLELNSLGCVSVNVCDARTHVPLHLFSPIDSFVSKTVSLERESTESATTSDSFHAEDEATESSLLSSPLLASAASDTPTERYDESRPTCRSIQLPSLRMDFEAPPQHLTTHAQSRHSCLTGRPQSCRLPHMSVRSRSRTPQPLEHPSSCVSHPESPYAHARIQHPVTHFNFTRPPSTAYLRQASPAASRPQFIKLRPKPESPSRKRTAPNTPQARQRTGDSDRTIASFRSSLQSHRSETIQAPVREKMKSILQSEDSHRSSGDSLPEEPEASASQNLRIYGDESKRGVRDGTSSNSGKRIPQSSTPNDKELVLMSNNLAAPTELPKEAAPLRQGFQNLSIVWDDCDLILFRVNQSGLHIGIDKTTGATKEFHVSSSGHAERAASIALKEYRRLTETADNSKEAKSVDRSQIEEALCFLSASLKESETLCLEDRDEMLGRLKSIQFWFHTPFNSDKQNLNAKYAEVQALRQSVIGNRRECCIARESLVAAVKCAQFLLTSLPQCLDASVPNSYVEMCVQALKESNTDTKRILELEEQLRSETEGWYQTERQAKSRRDILKGVRLILLETLGSIPSFEPETPKEIFPNIGLQNVGEATDSEVDECTSSTIKVYAKTVKKTREIFDDSKRLEMWLRRMEAECWRRRHDDIFQREMRKRLHLAMRQAHELKANMPTAVVMEQLEAILAADIDVHSAYSQFREVLARIQFTYSKSAIAEAVPFRYRHPILAKCEELRSFLDEAFYECQESDQNIQTHFELNVVDNDLVSQTPRDSGLMNLHPIDHQIRSETPLLEGTLPQNVQNKKVASMNNAPNELRISKYFCTTNESLHNNANLTPAESQQEHRQQGQDEPFDQSPQGGETRGSKCGSTRESQREATRESPPETVRESKREATRESRQESNKNPPRESSRDPQGESVPLHQRECSQGNNLDESSCREIFATKRSELESLCLLLKAEREQNVKARENLLSCLDQTMNLYASADFYTVSFPDYQLVIRKLAATQSWVHSNPDAGTEEYERVLRKLQRVANSVAKKSEQTRIAKLHLEQLLSEIETMCRPSIQLDALGNLILRKCQDVRQLLKCCLFLDAQTCQKAASELALLKDHYRVSSAGSAATPAWSSPRAAPSPAPLVTLPSWAPEFRS
eukprot:Gregarina_sp_Poly_1__10849@NODE_840_length_6028_cov_82_045630_g607_i0_p1_GENE_NODE_840_length_6028_cov_82_045630_g607_i0NODE_840_length_6028_cov_82_045630_g607_i0_p1_ORF_typecomplete_len1537_score288_80SQHop_cyclase_C/PF13243_6/0_16_NODE_840_length_6028_cov_82_045630_g607_i01344744